MIETSYWTSPGRKLKRSGCVVGLACSPLHAWPAKKKCLGHLTSGCGWALQCSFDRTEVLQHKHACLVTSTFFLSRKYRQIAGDVFFYFLEWRKKYQTHYPIPQLNGLVSSSGHIVQEDMTFQKKTRRHATQGRKLEKDDSWACGRRHRSRSTTTQLSRTRLAKKEQCLAEQERN